MKSILILLSIVSVGYAGVGVLTPEIEAEALRLWAKYCDGASEGGNDGNAFIYCKKSGEKIEESLQHESQLTANPSTSEQVVFVQPPSYHYKHDVVVSGGGASAPKTVIYVKPAKNTHEVNVEDKTSEGAAPQKPTLYFLKGSHGGDAPAGEELAQAASRRRRHHLPGLVDAEQGQTASNQASDSKPPSALAVGNAEEVGGRERRTRGTGSPRKIVYILKKLA